MQHDQLTTNPRPRKRRQTAWLLATALAATMALSIAPIADGAASNHKVNLDSTIFAAQVGSTPTGGSVFAGAVVDPKLGHGATVYNTSGTTTLKVGFHVFFALGSIRGNGSITITPGSDGQATFTGQLKVTGGTGKYRGARGKLTTAANINNKGQVMATLKGPITY